MRHSVFGMRKTVKLGYHWVMHLRGNLQLPFFMIAHVEVQTNIPVSVASTHKHVSAGSPNGGKQLASCNLTFRQLASLPWQLLLSQSF